MKIGYGTKKIKDTKYLDSNMNKNPKQTNPMKPKPNAEQSAVANPLRHLYSQVFTQLNYQTLCQRSLSRRG